MRPARQPCPAVSEATTFQMLKLDRAPGLLLSQAYQHALKIRRWLVAIPSALRRNKREAIAIMFKNVLGAYLAMCVKDCAGHLLEHTTDITNNDLGRGIKFHNQISIIGRALFAQPQTIRDVCEI